MVTKEQLVTGITKFIDNEVLPPMPTSSKWAAGTATILALRRIDQLLLYLQSNTLFQALGVVNQNGMIDSDAVLDALFASANSYGNLVVAFPIIGTLTFTASDVEKLKYYISGDLK